MKTAVTLKIFLTTLLWNIVTIILIVLVSIGLTFLLQNSSLSVSPFIIIGLVLLLQLYINGRILQRQSKYSLLNIIICLIQILILWYLALRFLFQGM
jgi:hypothetical protein